MGKRVKHKSRKTKKETRQDKNPLVAKQTKQEIDPGNYDLLKASWRFHRAWKDTTRSICINQWKDWENDILPKLILYQDKTWAEIKNMPKGHGDGSKHHNIDVNNLTKEAKAELENLHIFVDCLFSLRLTGKKRVLGILDKGVLEILFYTPNHEFT